MKIGSRKGRDWGLLNESIEAREKHEKKVAVESCCFRINPTPSHDRNGPVSWSNRFEHFCRALNSAMNQHKECLWVFRPNSSWARVVWLHDRQVKQLHTGVAGWIMLAFHQKSFFPGYCWAEEHQGPDGLSTVRMRADASRRPCPANAYADVLAMYLLDDHKATRHDLAEWAGANPRIWGNAYGDAMFGMGEAEAFGTEGVTGTASVPEFTPMKMWQRFNNCRLSLVRTTRPSLRARQWDRLGRENWNRRVAKK